MDIKILEKKENKLLNRLEVRFAVDHSGKPTPKREEIRKKLCALLNCKENTMIIKKLITPFGKNITIGKANVYKSHDDLKKVEPKYLIKRDFPEKEKEKPKEENKGE